MNKKTYKAPQIEIAAIEIPVQLMDSTSVIIHSQRNTPASEKNNEDYDVGW